MDSPERTMTVQEWAETERTLPEVAPTPQAIVDGLDPGKRIRYVEEAHRLAAQHPHGMAGVLAEMRRLSRKPNRAERRAEEVRRRAEARVSPRVT